MYRLVYRIISIGIVLAMTVGSYSIAKATPVPLSSDTQTSGKPPVYAYYYLWWSAQHWRNKLGSNYPYSASPLPLPATTDVDGCNAVSNFVGNQLIDVPTTLVSQDDPGAIENDIRTAKNAGISGFWINWTGDGTTTQTRTSVTYTRRLAEAFAASARVGSFRNWISYKAASTPSADAIINDLNFVYNEFKNETAWERFDGKPVVTFTGSREYSDADVLKISNALRDRMFLVGDESRSTLTPARIAMFDAITYYWSSQDPWGNPQSFSQIKEMGDKVHAAGKRWYAPLNPGFNSTLLTGGTTCIPRRNGETIRTIWNGNLASNPDGWGFISWNEISENTHIKPMQKWGTSSLNVLSLLINPIPPPGKATLNSPNGSIGTNYTPTYIWKKVSDATWYYLWVNGPSGNVIQQWYESSAVCNGDTCSTTPSTTLKGGAHTWWIQTWNLGGYGPWSAGMNFNTTAIPLPTKATLSSPNGNISTQTPTYTWNNVSGATWYYLWINGPSGNVFKQWYETSAICTSETCSVTPSITLASGAHTWWVQTWNMAGVGPWSDGMNFSVTPPALPGKATLVLPSGSSGSNTPTYTWNEVSGSTWYYLWVNGPSGNVIKTWYTSAQANCNGSTCSVTPSTALSGGAHTWWIQTWNNTGVGPWSDGMNFTAP